MRGIDLGLRRLNLAGASRKAFLAGVIGSSLFLGGCGSRLQQFTGSISDLGRGNSAESRSDPIADLARRYDAKPGDKRASLEYAAALRANGQHPQAVAVLQRTSIDNVGDRDVAAAYGKALADIGRFEQASEVLARAHSEDRPNWRVLSTQGSIADQMNNHIRAREFYHRALQIAPNEPSILNNLGLSYVLTKELALAEATLRKAASQPGADPRIQANLELAIRLQGRNNGSKTGSSAPVPAPASAAAPAPAVVTPTPTPTPAPAEARTRTASTSGSLWKASQREALPAKANVEKTATEKSAE